MTSSSGAAIPIICGTDTCPNRGDVINIVLIPSVRSAEMFLEAFGQGSEDSEDYCPECKQLGIVED